MALDNHGDTAQIQGSGKKPYTLKNSGGVLSCDCPAWRNQSDPIDKRTCKHLRKLRGDVVEDVRIGKISFNTEGTTSGRFNVTGGPNLSNVPRTEKEKKVAAAEKEVGRKLRPDEKVKLLGPPLLLAHQFEDSDADPSGWWCSEKLDGVRALWDGEKFLSRQGNTFHAPTWFKDGLPDHPLDGELWMGRKRFQETISVVKSVDSGDRWKEVKYLVFDMPHLDLPFEDRVSRIQDWHSAARPPYAEPVLHTPIDDIRDLKQGLHEVVSAGGEGLMIRKPGSKYEVGRSHTLLKVKPWREAEAKVIGHEPGKGRHKGRLGALVVRTPGGVEFNVGTGLSDEERRKPPQIGAVITYRYMELTDANVPKGASYVCVRDYE